MRYLILFLLSSQYLLAQTTRFDPAQTSRFVAGRITPFVHTNGTASYSKITTGLVAWYKFAGDANDYSGNGNNAIAQNTPLYTTGPNGAATTAILFDGVSQFAQTPITSVNYPNGTISWWMNPSTAYNSGTVRVFWGQLTGGSTAPELSGQVFSDNNFYVGWSAASDARVMLAASAANYGGWHYYVLAWNGSGTVLYLDGVSIGSSAVVPNVSNIGSAFIIGRDGFTSSYFSGAIAGWSLYSVTFSSGDAMNQYQAGINGNIF